MDSYAKHLFSDAAKQAQAGAGMRDKYERVYETRLTDGLQPDAIAFIESRTSFYMASIAETGWPYIQHRGGPAGFLKVIDTDTLGFADYRGNQQFITSGNLQTNDKVSLILMDYPRRARLKLIGHASMIAADENPELAQKLAQEGQGPAERLVTIRLVAQDWNCPQYITPRFTEAEIADLLGPRLNELNRQIGVLADRLTALGEDPSALLQDTKDKS
ncbi:pyridoxamine 5'-phosphate oxidase family protein [Cognatiyoonia sp. IB215182]|uniref:pyridoxamine 5'-phosphate oxidase family protein n=1 Tax=Cognatiyoonia sp. IB215182 TaxID=3097353 RepID=UPI002A172D1B|nr:pyridoxamine 5'-phosphate oxidase family protein [Cognatiyoonia sp. IB215182]MDX8351450.1 pyridoxamine 5'-phosphate oxidase family protein [Cognatiyoonia sp. IB215182]